MQFRAVDPAEPPAADLIEAMITELEPLYGRIDVPHAPSASPADFRPPTGTFLVGFDEDGTPVCGGGVKGLGDGIGEIKRMYVVPGARGRGAARELLTALEAAVVELGYTRARLDTGPEQPHAEALYRSAGYADIENFNGNPFASYWGEKRLR